MFIVATGIPWPPALNDSPASLSRLSPFWLSYVNVQCFKAITKNYFILTGPHYGASNSLSFAGPLTPDVFKY